MTLSGFHHVGITVSDAARAVKFYQEVFGGSLIGEFDLPSERVRALLGADAVSGKVTWIKLPGVGVELFSFEPRQPAERVVWNRPGCTHFALQVTDIDAWHAELTAKNVECLGPPKQSGPAWFFYAKDPDGTLIELIEIPDR